MNTTFDRPFIITVSELNGETIISRGIVQDASGFLDDDELMDFAWQHDDEPVLLVTYTAFMIGSDLPGDADTPTVDELDEIRELYEDDMLDLNYVQSGRYRVYNPYAEDEGTWDDERCSPWTDQDFSIRDFI